MSWPYYTYMVIYSSPTPQMPQTFPYLIFFLADNSKNFGLIACLLWETEVTEQNWIHSEKWNNETIVNPLYSLWVQLSLEKR